MVKETDFVNLIRTDFCGVFMNTILTKQFPVLVDYIISLRKYSDFDMNSINGVYKQQKADAIEFSKSYIDDIQDIAINDNYSAENIENMYRKYCNEWENFSNSEIAKIIRSDIGMLKCEKYDTTADKS